MTGRHGMLHVLAVVGAALLWSTSFAVTKVVLADVGELTLGAVRFLAAAVLLIVVCLLASQRLRASRSVHRDVALLGLVGISAYFTLENYGVALATATDAALIVASYPAITMLGELLVSRVVPSVIHLVGAGVAFVGVFLVVADQASAPAPHRAWGIVLLLLGGIVWAAYNMMSARMARDVDPASRLGVVSSTALQNLWGGLGFVLLIPFLPQGRTVDVSMESAVLTLYLALGCSAAAFLFYTYGLTALKPAQAVALLNLVPVFGVVWAVLIAGERPTVLKVVGALVVIAGVTLSTRPAGPRSSEKSNTRSAVPSEQGASK